MSFPLLLDSDTRVFSVFLSEKKKSVLLDYKRKRSHFTVENREDGRRGLACQQGTSDSYVQFLPAELSRIMI